MLVERVIPAIEQQWPQAYQNTPIWIQQDNALSHIPPDNAAFVARVGQLDLNIEPYFQPSNSPDLNVLDLGFFASLQAMVANCGTRNKQFLIQAVNAKFATYPSQLHFPVPTDGNARDHSLQWEQQLRFKA